jgi:hypothetical protein
MKLEVKRFSSQSNSTLGMLFDVTGKPRFLCYTLEDESRDVKVKGRTRIPSGTYKVTLRKEGGLHQRYTKKFGSDFNKGMLWVRNVPNFEYILIHIGNTDLDSEGCLLLGDTQTQNITQNGFIGSSTDAYKRVYPQIADVLVNGGEVSITYVDYD